MGIAVKKGKESNDQNVYRMCELYFADDKDTKYKTGKQDHYLDTRDGNTGYTRKTSKTHDTHKRKRQ